ncbi:GDSL-type esterase/lipase family protein [Sporomusa aerivorans]|uniref:GDSL-type esterase/lipase family protein n=1 Tax=Sporomusa aerivorans TaxID=204936 RepID=UPI00352A939C
MLLRKITAILLLFLTVTVPAFAQPGKVQLVWPHAEDVVMYELEVARVKVADDAPAPAAEIVYTSTSIYTPGVELNLASFAAPESKKLYYRVRPLDLDSEPIGRFSRPSALLQGKLNSLKPATTTNFTDRPTPLYMVYSWIPVLGAARYEVEVTNHIPERENGITPSKYRVRAYSVGQVFDFYDPQPFTREGCYYWRVIAFDENNKAIGAYSDAVPFRVERGVYKWATYGDSITHGGGAVSNPPSDARYDYAYYLPFAVKNLGKSGDTAAALAERFEQDVLPFKPEVMLILGGTNSIRGGVSAAEVIDSLTTIREKCEKYSIKPVFLTLPPLNPERIQRVFNQPTADNWQQELKKVNAFIKTQPDYIDVYAALVDDKGLLPVKYAQDGLHPDIAGKKVMAREVNAYINSH